MLSFSRLVCPSCGAPLPAEALMRVVTCAFCGASVAAEDGLVSAAAYRRVLADLEDEARDATDLSVGGHPYRLLGQIGTGESSDVYLGERASPLAERVIVKALRDRDDAVSFDREWDVLSALATSTAQGGPQLSRRVPQLVARGDAAGRAFGERAVLVLRASSGFTHTLEQARVAHGGAIDARHAVWMWRRVLELLGFVHRSGWAHAAILPQHWILHPRDHGVMLVGWSCAARTDARAPLFREAQRAFYPDELLHGAPPSERSDIMMSARCVAAALGGDPATGTVPASVPAGFAALLRGVANAPYTDDAWALKEDVAQAAKQAFGPPKYVPFHLPGWRH